MNIKRAITYFRTYFNVEPSDKIDGWYRFTDPFDNHRDQSMTVNFNRQLVYGWRSGYRGSMFEFIQEYEQIDTKEDLNDYLDEFEESEFDQIEEEIVYNDDPIDWPEEYIPLDIGKNLAVPYLESRGFNAWDFVDKGFGYCMSGFQAMRMIVPCMYEGQLQFYQGRSLLPGMTPKYLNVKLPDREVHKSLFFYNEDLLDTLDHVYLCEGWSDAETCETGIASFGWKLSKHQFDKLLQKRSFLEAITVVSDKGFYEKQVAQFSPYADYLEIKVLNLDNEPGKDANDLGYDRIREIEDSTDILSIINLIDLL